eukprot:gene5695-biopygen14803
MIKKGAPFFAALGYRYGDPESICRTTATGVTAATATTAGNADGETSATAGTVLRILGPTTGISRKCGRESLSLSRVLKGLAQQPQLRLCASARRGGVRHRVLARLPDAPRAPQPTPVRGAGRRRGSAGGAPAAACGLSSSLFLDAGAARRRRLGGGGAGAAPRDERASEPESEAEASAAPCERAGARGARAAARVPVAPRARAQPWSARRLRAPVWAPAAPSSCRHRRRRARAAAAGPSSKDAAPALSPSLSSSSSSTRAPAAAGAAIGRAAAARGPGQMRIAKVDLSLKPLVRRHTVHCALPLAMTIVRQLLPGAGGAPCAFARRVSCRCRLRAWDASALWHSSGSGCCAWWRRWWDANQFAKGVSNPQWHLRFLAARGTA